MDPQVAPYHFDDGVLAVHAAHHYHEAINTMLRVVSLQPSTHEFVNVYRSIQPKPL